MDFSALSQTPSRQLEHDSPPYSCPSKPSSHRQLGVIHNIMEAREDLENIKTALSLYGGVSMVSDLIEIFGDD